MQLYSTNNKNLRIDFREAVFNSLPVDNGLYMPVEIPRLPTHFIDTLDQFSLPEIAVEVAKHLIGSDIPSADVEKIIKDSLNFDAPLVALKDGTSVLELFHGPSLAFKDFGARFMSRVMAYFSNQTDQVLDVLVATSGDTGGAVALGFLDVPGTRVTILYPKGKVSEIQELQLCTNAKNIRALEIDGTFDDCQAMVKRAFNDHDLKKKLRLTSANSINIARLIPQSFYYFHAYGQLLQRGIKKVVFSVPSGNFGNIGAGLLAYKMGLPVEQFIAATNANDVVPRFLKDGKFEPKTSVQTLSNAMDVGNPSNWMRIMDLFNHERGQLKALVTSYSFSDTETEKAINDIERTNQYIACPHTAIAWLALQTYINKKTGDYASVFLSTAHPCKFPTVYGAAMAEKIRIPEQVAALAEKEQKKTALGKDYPRFRDFLMQNS